MSIVSLENVVRHYTSEPVLDSVTLGIDRGEKVGVIGVNGCGKSTLLRIVAGREDPDAGRLVVARGTTIAYLPQNPSFDPDLTVLDAVFVASTETMQLLHDYEEACHALGSGSHAPHPDGSTDPLMRRVADLAARLEASGGWDLETNARMVLQRLGVTDTTATMGSLSGGMRKRVALAHALITRPDLLVLDEPTNHLDTDAVAWLENYLAQYTGTLVLVTHDRYFLDRVTTRTLEIERGRIQVFTGNYASYLEKKQEQEAQRVAAEERRDNLIRQELEWLRRGARARSTKQKAHVQRVHALLDETREGGPSRVEISVAGRRLGKKTIEMRHVSKAFDGRPIVRDFTYTLKRGDRVGIIGPNGSGKTTLLELMTGRLTPDAGEIERGETIVIGYYDQESRALDDSMRVLDYVREEADAVRTAEGKTLSASQMLERFLFTGPMQHALIGRLSGGERRRLYLLRVLMRNPNVLILDEPTNDLDIPTLVRLEDYLDGFGGCLVVVSHDRYFLDRTVDSIFRLEGEGRIREYAGNFTDSEEARQKAQLGGSEEASTRSRAARPQPNRAIAPSQETGEPAPPPRRSRRLSTWEEKEMQALEAEIEAGEEKRRSLEADLAGDSSDYARTQALYDELQALGRRLDEAMGRWTELAELQG